MSAFVKMDKTKILATLDWDACGITSDMVKCRGKYVEITIKEIIEKETIKAKGVKTTKVTLIPDFKGIFTNRNKPYETLQGHTLLVVLSPLASTYAGIPQSYILEEEDLDNFGEYKVSFYKNIGDKTFKKGEWLYRIYTLN